MKVPCGFACGRLRSWNDCVRWTTTTSAAVLLLTLSLQFSVFQAARNQGPVVLSRYSPTKVPSGLRTKSWASGLKALQPPSSIPTTTSKSPSGWSTPASVCFDRVKHAGGSCHFIGFYVSDQIAQLGVGPETVFADLFGDDFVGLGLVYCEQLSRKNPRESDRQYHSLSRTSIAFSSFSASTNTARSEPR